ncbi:hypothetical protein IFM89_019308 [Coptis chinensis]|uniref:Uncharacterized protein n=1 Tax=Coptis chinensis TaxID=261450 RepID=A0A835M8H2_9MAGN|nr:hypothetical protein IFM89_019308 [Coptis chinensis]
MEHTKEIKHKKLEKLIKYGKKLKNIVTLHRKSSDRLVSPPRAVHHDELFRKSAKANVDDDPVLAAFILAQNHFSLRPNIYI